VEIVKNILSLKFVTPADKMPPFFVFIILFCNVDCAGKVPSFFAYRSSDFCCRPVFFSADFLTKVLTAIGISDQYPGELTIPPIAVRPS